MNEESLARVGPQRHREKKFFQKHYPIALNVGKEKCHRLYGGKLIFKRHLNEWEQRREEYPEGFPEPLKY